MYIDELTVIIVSYNSYAALQLCMDNWLLRPSCRVLVVDNASKDGSADKIAARYPGVELLREPINLGYGRGANRGLKEVTTPYALLLNADIIASATEMDALVVSARRLPDNFAILAPAVTEKDFLRQGLLERRWVIGAAMFFNMNVMKKLGFFDENIFLFSEETDLCRRAVDAGFGIYLDSDIYVKHLLKQSSAPSQEVERLKHWHMAWSRMYYRKKYGLNVGRKAEWRVLTGYFVRSVTATNMKKRAAYRARFLGACAFMRGESAFCEDGWPQQSIR